MNANGILEPTLKDILEAVKPLREDWVVRSEIIEELKCIVSSIESFRGATVEPFGSFVSNLFTRSGDLDISVLFLNGSCIPSSGKKRKQNLLVELLKAMRQKGGWRRLQFVPNARVPILKFESGRRSISCDISIDNVQGQMKSKFLFWINQIDGRFRDMVLLVKEWAKVHKINDPKCGTLNSYSLSLLVIFHFQTCVPAILPPLREIYPRNVVDDLIGERIAAEEQIKEICNTNILKYMSNKHRAINQSSLSELFISFLAKFSDIGSKAAELGICTFMGEWQDIRSTMKWLPKTYAIFIEDPYEQPENTARAVSAGSLQRISMAFQMTYQSLILANLNRISLLGILVRPHILNSIVPGAPFGNSSYTLAQMGGPMHSPSQPQHHVWDARRDRCTNSITNREQYKHRSNNLMSRVQSMTLEESRPGSARLEKHPNYFTNPRDESLPDFTKLERHPDHLTKQREEILSNSSTMLRNQSRPNTTIRLKPAVRHNSQEQRVWRPKSN